ncbi:MAG TPA: hypothetical protein VFU95_09045 [Telluria sp.]|nr:hypothetical protein [Telluria sp.]
MRIFYKAALLATVIALAAPAVLAHPHDDGAPRRYYITPQEAREVSGTYGLSNGDILKVSREKRRYWAEMQSTGRIEIIPVAPRTFVDASGTIRFEFMPYDWPDEVKITGLPPYTPPVSATR